MAQTIWYKVGFKAYQINLQSHDHSIIMASSAQWPLLLTWFNFNPSMDK